MQLYPVKKSRRNVMKNNNFLRIGSILLAALLLFGSKSQENIEACSLLKKSEVEAAISSPVLEPQKEAGKMGEIKYSHCTYKKKSGMIGVLLSVYKYQSKAEVKKYFENSMKEVGKLTPVPGLGDGAYWWKSKTTFFVIKDNYMISIISGTDEVGLKAAKSMAEKAAKNMAEKVVNRLP